MPELLKSKTISAIDKLNQMMREVSPTDLEGLSFGKENSVEIPRDGMTIELQKILFCRNLFLSNMLKWQGVKNLDSSMDRIDAQIAFMAVNKHFFEKIPKPLREKMKANLHSHYHLGPLMNEVWPEMIYRKPGI